MGYNIDAQQGNSAYMWAICRYSEIIADRWVWIFLSQLKSLCGLKLYVHLQFQFKPHQWNDTIFKLFYNKSYTDSHKCLKIMHDLTDSVIRDRKAEYKWGKMMFYIELILK